MTAYLSSLIKLGTIGKGDNKRIDYSQLSIRMSTSPHSVLHKESENFDHNFMEGFVQSLMWLTEKNKEAWEVLEAYRSVDHDIPKIKDKTSPKLKKLLGERNAYAYALCWAVRPKQT